MEIVTYDVNVFESVYNSNTPTLMNGLAPQILDLHGLKSLGFIITFLTVKNPETNIYQLSKI